MNEPWYESTGPCYLQVRDDVSNILNKKDWSDDKKNLIIGAIIDSIPDTRNDFGSYRGYATFRVAHEISTQVENTINKKYKKICAMKTLKEKFIPIVEHWLYKPGGIRMKEVLKNTKLGKKAKLGHWYSGEE